MAGIVVTSIATSLAGYRLRRLLAKGAIQGRLAAYYAPMAGGPVVLGSSFDLRRNQRARLIQGRNIRLIFSHDHREIGDPWLSRWVLVQRAGLILIVGAAALMFAR